jgi:DNA-binding transcriptional LysR family regulator
VTVGSYDLPLLVTEGRRAVLTEHGRTLLTRVRPLLRDLESLEALARQLKQGFEPEIALVVDLAFPREVLLKAVIDLRERCPSTQVTLADAVLSGAEDAIVDGAADVMITTRVPPGFLGDLLVEVDFRAVAAPSHPLFEASEPLTTTQLERHTQIVVRDSGTRQPRDDGWLGVGHRMTVSSLEGSLATVRSGLGFAWLPLHLVQDDLAAGTLRALPLAAGGTRSVPLYVVLVRPDLAAPAARTAVDCLRAHSAAAGTHAVR